MKTAFLKGSTIGITGLVALIVSWGAIWVGPFIVPPPWVPRVWLVTIVVVLPCAVVAGVFAARMTSKWWYVLAGAGFLSAAFLLANAAV
jgi:hypothetical protein